jgi:flavin reductase (DIM6/NTAB) family NADH-FMN oxidoreductase RutF
VVITVPGRSPAAVTATSLTSGSLDPPLVSFCSAHTTPARPSAADVAVHVLTQEREHAARTFPTSGIDRCAAHRDRTPAQAESRCADTTQKGTSL